MCFVRLPECTCYQRAEFPHGLQPTQTHTGYNEIKRKKKKEKKKKRGVSQSTRPTETSLLSFNESTDEVFIQNVLLQCLRIKIIEK